MDCKVSQVVRDSDKVLVYCYNSVTVGSDTVSFAAVAVPGNDAQAERFESLALIALNNSRYFMVDFPTSSTSNPTGCSPSNCRKPNYFGLRNAR